MPRSRKDSVSESSDEGVWEDISDSKKARGETGARVSSPLPSSSSPPRKRKLARPRRQHTAPLPAKPARTPAIVLDRDEWLEGISTGVMFAFRYTVDVVGQAVRLLRRPLSVLIFLWLLSFIFVRISHTLKAAFAPLCIIPGISSSPMCVVPHPPRGQGKLKPQWADYPKMVDVQSSTFEQLLDESVGGSGLSLEIKKAEMATSDLIALVRVSNNLKSRDMLAESLLQFVNDAKKTGRGLQKLSSKIGGAVDGILAVNDYALHTIEAAIADAPSSYSLRYLVPWYSSRPTNEIVTQTFTEAMDVLSGSMQRLIMEAEVSLANLGSLEEHLSTLHEVVSREDSSISSAKSELLSELWTKVGGNRRALRGYDDHLLLLKNLGGYRKSALVHVVSALQTLQAMSEDMEDLRERVAAPELTAGRIPVEVHMKSIKSGLERLREGRLKAKEREEEAIKRVLAIGDE